MPLVRRHAWAVLFVLAGVLFTPAAAVAQSLQVDLNGDGVRDRVDAGARRTELTIYIANQRRIQLLRTDDAIVRLAIADVDSDGDSDLVASTRRVGLHVWINHGRGRFVRLVSPDARSRGTSRLASLHTSARQTGSSNEWNDDAKLLIQPTTYGSAHACIATRARPPSRTPDNKLRFDRRVPRGPPCRRSS
jgi:hypothetical protein